MKVVTLLAAMALGFGVAAANVDLAGAQTGIDALIKLSSVKASSATIESQLEAALSAAGKKLTQEQLDQTTRQIQRQLAAAGGTAEGKVRVDAWGLVIEVEW